MKANKPEVQQLTKQQYFDHFRVAIFGSARVQPDDKVYKTVFDLAQNLARENIDIVTGGGPGLMEAANAGHKSLSNGNVESIGLTIQLPEEVKGNRHLDIKRHFFKFSSRLDYFMKISNVVIVMPGGIGTCLELFFAWQLTQVHHVEMVPIILHGEMWHELYEWVRAWPLQQKLMNEEDIDHVFCVHSNAEAMKIILDARKQFEAKQKIDSEAR